MQTFELHRVEDETGVSGTGRVAQGVIFDNGRVAMTWLTKTSSVAIYNSIEDVRTIHGHGGKTLIVLQNVCAAERHGELGLHRCVRDPRHTGPHADGKGSFWYNDAPGAVPDPRGISFVPREGPNLYNRVDDYIPDLEREIL